MRELARGKRGRDNGGAAGDGPIGCHVQSLSPDHDATHLAAIKMRHRVDVTRIVETALQRHRRLFGWPAWYLFSCHRCHINWITGFARIIQQISLPKMAIALADLLDEKHVTLRLRSRKPANAVREIIQLLAANRKIDDAEELRGQVIAREVKNKRVAGSS